MGIAAYNRGSRAISESIYGPARPLPAPKPRPASWGEKTRLAAEEKARRLVKSNRRYGLPVTPDFIAGAVQMSVRCTDAVALAAAILAIKE